MKCSRTSSATPAARLVRAVVHGDQDRGDREVLVQVRLDHLDGLDQLAEALERVVLGLDRDQHLDARDQRVQGEQAERRRAVDEDVVEAVSSASTDPVVRRQRLRSRLSRATTLTSSISAPARSIVAGTSEQVLDVRVLLDDFARSGSRRPARRTTTGSPAGARRRARWRRCPGGRGRRRGPAGRPARAPTARFTVEVVLPTPPFWLATTITRVRSGRGNGSPKLMRSRARSSASIARASGVEVSLNARRVRLEVGRSTDPRGFGGVLGDRCRAQARCAPGAMFHVKQTFVGLWITGGDLWITPLSGPPSPVENSAFVFSSGQPRRSRAGSDPHSFTMSDDAHRRVEDAAAELDDPREPTPCPALIAEAADATSACAEEPFMARNDPPDLTSGKDHRLSRVHRRHRARRSPRRTTATPCSSSARPRSTSDVRQPQCLRPPPPGTSSCAAVARPGSPADQDAGSPSPVRGGRRLTRCRTRWPRTRPASVTTAQLSRWRSHSRGTSRGPISPRTIASVASRSRVTPRPSPAHRETPPVPRRAQRV